MSNAPSPRRDKAWVELKEKLYARLVQLAGKLEDFSDPSSTFNAGYVLALNNEAQHIQDLLDWMERG